MTPSENAETAAPAQGTPCHLDVAAADAAARLLNGAGRMTISCHDDIRGHLLDTSFHGAAQDGTRYMVVSPQEGQWPPMPIERPQHVSMTIAAEAPVAEIRMTVAELSGNAVVTRCAEDEETALLSEGPLPSEIARTFTCWPGSQLWRVEPLRMTIHHIPGCHMLDREALAPRPSWPDPAEELETIELLRIQWGTHLTGLLTELRPASTPTAEHPHAPGGVRCATGRAYPVSLSDRELMLLLVDGPHRDTVAVPLPHPVSSPEEFIDALREAIGAPAESR